MSKHFTIDELCRSDIAEQKGIDNTPGPEIVANLEKLIAVLDEIRDLVGGPVIVSSGYRCEKLNAAAGGSRTSAHRFGLAADITTPRMSPKKLAELIRDSGIEFDQCIHEFGRWVHVGLAKGVNRGQVLSAVKVNGKTVYKNGIV